MLQKLFIFCQLELDHSILTIVWRALVSRIRFRYHDSGLSSRAIWSHLVSKMKMGQRKGHYINSCKPLPRSRFFGGSAKYPEVLQSAQSNQQGVRWFSMGTCLMFFKWHATCSICILVNGSRKITDKNVERIKHCQWWYHDRSGHSFRPSEHRWWPLIKWPANGWHPTCRQWHVMPGINITHVSKRGWDISVQGETHRVFVGADGCGMFWWHGCFPGLSRMQWDLNWGAWDSSQWLEVVSDIFTEKCMLKAQDGRIGL